MIHNYYYNKQLKNWIIQFSSIFAGLQVCTGTDENTGEMLLEDCSVRYGSADRVVSAINSKNTQNALLKFPMLSVYMRNINLAPERKKGNRWVDQRVTMPVGGVFPDDLQSTTRVMPIPYDLEMEVTMIASNMDEAMQILEQLLILFDPDLQIQKSDDINDMGAITTVEMTGISNEENHPPGQERRKIIWTFTFKLPIWLGLPMDVKSEIVKRIKIQFGDLDSFVLNEYDENGELQPFAAEDSLGNIDIGPGSSGG